MTTCGVNPNLYQAYEFDDHFYALTSRQDLLELAQLCVKVDDWYYMKLPRTEAWAPVKTLADAKKQAKNTWLNQYMPCGVQITADLVNTFFDGDETTYHGKQKITTHVGSCPRLQGRIVIPYGPRFVTYEGRHYLNEAQSNVMQGNEAHLRDGLAVLLMVYRSLCNGPQLSANMREESELLLKQVIENDYTHLEFRFLMNWIAAIVQTPGINLQTNVWIVGELEGIGKGTFTSIIRTILGSSLVGVLQRGDIERDWNDCLFGKVLIEANEFKTTSGRPGIGPEWWHNWIKEYTCENQLKIMQRGTTPWTTLNIGNYIFTCNNEDSPVYLGPTDRRNMIIKATNDDFFKSWASVIKVERVDKHAAQVAAGFAWILEQVKVDLALINSAPLTQVKADIQANSTPPLQQWLFETDDPDRDVWRVSGYLYADYSDWFRNSIPGKNPETKTLFGRMMGKLAQKGMVEMRAGRGSTEYKIPATLARRLPKSHLSEAAAGLASVIDEEVIHQQHHDQEIKLLDEPRRALTKMERLREALAREDNVIPFRVGDVA